MKVTEFGRDFVPVCIEIENLEELDAVKTALKHTYDVHPITAMCLRKTAEDLDFILCKYSDKKEEVKAKDG